MKITKDMLDRKISEFEVDGLEITYREWINDTEDVYELEHRDLDLMTDEELDNYDTWLWELSLK